MGIWQPHAIFTQPIAFIYWHFDPQRIQDIFPFFCHTTANYNSNIVAFSFPQYNAIVSYNLYNSMDCSLFGFVSCIHIMVFRDYQSTILYLCYYSLLLLTSILLIILSVLWHCKEQYPSNSSFSKSISSPHNLQCLTLF